MIITEEILLCGKNDYHLFTCHITFFYYHYILRVPEKRKGEIYNVFIETVCGNWSVH